MRERRAGQKGSRKNRALKYIFCISYESVVLCIHLFTGTRPLSLLLHEKVTMIGPTLLKQWLKAIQHVQTYTIKCLSLRTYHLLIFQPQPQDVKCQSHVPSSMAQASTRLLQLSGSASGQITRTLQDQLLLVAACKPQGCHQGPRGRGFPLATMSITYVCFLIVLYFFSHVVLTDKTAFSNQ